jgi:hypothetical protein
LIRQASTRSSRSEAAGYGISACFNIALLYYTFVKFKIRPEFGCGKAVHHAGGAPAAATIRSVEGNFEKRPEAPPPLCVPKSKSERIDDEVRPVWRANL